MTSFVAVLPSVLPGWTSQCLDSMSGELVSHTRVVNNAPPRPNLGVAASWNVGVRDAQALEVEWLVVISAAMRFGNPGGTDFLDALDAAPADAWAIEAGEQPRREGHGFGWHCIAFHLWAFDRVGLFDENYWPAYWEDCDWAYRVRLACGWEPGADPIWPKVPLDADLEAYGHGIRFAGIETDPHALQRYYSVKWGGPPAHEEYDHPFGDPRHPLSWWPEPPPRP